MTVAAAIPDGAAALVDTAPIIYLLEGNPLAAGVEREIDADIAVLAARLRNRHHLRLPDAIQLAVALHEGGFAVVTHDRDFESVGDIPVLGMPR